QFLGQLEYTGLVLLRNAEDLHENPQGKVNRNIACEIAIRTIVRHAIDAGTGDGADAILKRIDGRTGKPVFRDPTVFRMIRLVHVYERADRMRAAAGPGARQIVGPSGQKRMRAIAAMEQIMLADDVSDVFVPRHQPKGIEVFAFHATERRVR